MAYKKIKPYDLTEDEMRQIWLEEYCKKEIETFDGVMVKFYEDMFDHIFYESANRKAKDKSLISYNRLEKIYWIKETLQDSTAVLKIGWNNEAKEYYKDRRIAIVKGNYVVVIRFTGVLRAKLITAFEKQDINNILNSPDFEKTVEFFGDRA